MSNGPCVVQVASYHGKSRQKRWHRCFRGDSRQECHLFIDMAVADVVADDPLASLLAQEQARENFRIYKLWGMA